MRRHCAVGSVWTPKTVFNARYNFAFGFFFVCLFCCFVPGGIFFVSSASLEARLQQCDLCCLSVSVSFAVCLATGDWPLKQAPCDFCLISLGANETVLQLPLSAPSSLSLFPSTLLSLSFSLSLYSLLFFLFLSLSYWAPWNEVARL